MMQKVYGVSYSMRSESNVNLYISCDAKSILFSFHILGYSEVYHGACVDSLCRI